MIRFSTSIMLILKRFSSYKINILLNKHTNTVHTDSSLNKLLTSLSHLNCFTSASTCNIYIFGVKLLKECSVIRARHKYLNQRFLLSMYNVYTSPHYHCTLSIRRYIIVLVCQSKSRSLQFNSLMTRGRRTDHAITFSCCYYAKVTQYYVIVKLLHVIN